MHERVRHRAVWLTLTLAIAAAPVLARADDADAPQAAADQVMPDDDSIVALDLEPLHPEYSAPATSVRSRNSARPVRVDVSRTDHADGSSTVVVKQPLPLDWDVNVGAELKLGPPPSTTFAPGRPLPGMDHEHTSGTAWASLGVVPNLATVDVCVDPGSEQGRIGTTLQHSVALGDDVSVTLRDNYTVSERFAAADTAPTSLPLTALPPPSDPVTSAPAWSNARSINIKLLPTGTTLTAAATRSSTDPVTHNVLSVDQQLYGPLHVTTSVTDIGEPNSNKSISAQLKLDW
jgi:hypothetical protein